MARKKSEVLSEELEVLRSELTVIGELEEASDEDIARGDALLEEWDNKSKSLEDELKREQRVAEVFAANIARNSAVENGDGPAAVRFGAPNVNRVVDPYDNGEVLRRSLMGDSLMNSRDTVSRAHYAVDEKRSHVDDAAKERMHALLDIDNRHSGPIARHMLLTGSQQYHDEFRDYLKSRGTMIGEAMRTALSLTDANGGYLVPFTLDPTIILTNSGITDPLRGISTVKTITTDTWNGVTSAGVTAEWLGQGSEAADKTPTFTQPTITPQKAAAWVFGSYEVLADSGFASELGRLLADAKANLEGAAFATGNTAASIPVGVVAGVAAVTASIVTSSTANALAVADVHRTANALRARDASQASWVGNKKIFSLVRQFDTAGGSAFWANLGMGVPPLLLGQPAYEASTMTGVITTSANVLLAGNFSEFYIVDRVGMSVMYEPMVKGSNQRPTGQAGWFAFWRVGSDVVDPDAFRLLQLNTTAAFTARA